MGNEFMSGILKSRKFWLAIFGVVQAVVLYYLEVPESLWQATSALIMVLIAAIAGEDMAEKANQ